MKIINEAIAKLCWYLFSFCANVRMNAKINNNMGSSAQNFRALYSLLSILVKPFFLSTSACELHKLYIPNKMVK